ncbi:MAG: TolC family protein, partial [Candidatus Brocadiae bacterium]|nr:TolC family protein [Candidatus Brocadiia bacterium]
MMKRFVRRGVLAALTAVLVLGSAGCFPTRGGLLSDLKRTRMDSYVRWRKQADKDELLPRMQGQLSIRDAIKFGLAHSPRVRSVLEEQAKSKGQLLTAYGEALPSVELTAGYTRLDQIMTIDLGVSSFSIGDRDNWTYQVNVTQPLFKGGSIPAAIRGAKIFQFLSDEQVRQVVQDAILAVALAYEDVLLGQHLYEVQVEALTFAKANLKDVIAKEQAGMAIPFDRLRARVEVSNVEADMIQQRNLLNRTWTALFRAMGVSQKSEVTLSDELVHVPMEPEF